MLAVLSRQHLEMVEEGMELMDAANAEAAKRTIIITIMVTTKHIRDN